MKRDLDLIRTILLKVEEDETLTGSVRSANPGDLGITDHTDAEVTYHSVLLIEAGFLAGNIEIAGQVLIFRLTWQGHEFLESVRNPETWQKTEGTLWRGPWRSLWPRPKGD
jgi:hypothetical protein